LGAGAVVAIILVVLIVVIGAAAGAVYYFKRNDPRFIAKLPWSKPKRSDETHASLLEDF